MTGNGAFGASSTPTNYHPHTSGSTWTPGAPLAEVYDFGHDGWSTGTPAFAGDFTYPGSPYEGWELQVGTGRNQAIAPVGFTAGSGGIGLTGSVTGYTNTGGNKRGYWTGTALSGQLMVNMTTRVDTQASWVIMTVRMYNTGATTLSNAYYLRTFDADIDQSWGGDYTTRNWITYQGDIYSRALVSTQGTLNPGYMGLGASDSRAKVFCYSTWPLPVSTDLSTVWAGTYPSSVFTAGAHADGDVAAGLIFDLGNIAAGDSAILAYAYVFNDSTGVDSVQTILCGGPLVAGVAVPNVTSACSTTPISISLSGASAYSATGYQWQSSPDSTTWTNISGATNSVYSFTGIGVTTYYRCRVWCKESGASVFTPGVRISYTSVCPCPGLTAGTASSTVTVACATTSITLNDAGYLSSGTTLQWQSSPDSLSWTNIPGATTVPYTFTGLSATTYYRLVVTCTASGGTAQSAGVKITFLTSCPCTGMTAGTATTNVTVACPATTIILNDIGYTATGTVVQWQSSPDSATWSNISGATTVPYTFSGLSATTYYRLVVTCIATGATAQTAGVRINFTPSCCAGLSAGTPSSSVATACPTTPITLNDAGYTTAGTTVQWQSSPDSATWTNIAGATTVPYTFTGLSATRYYRLVVTCTASGTSVQSAGVKVTFTAACPCLTLLAGTPSSSLTVACSTQTIVLNDAGYTSTGTTLQWQSSTDSATWSNIPGATTVPYSFSGLTTTTYYRLVVTCISSGTSVMTAGVKVNYVPICSCPGLTAGMVMPNVTVACPTTYVVVNATGYTSSGVTYQWQASTDSITWTNVPVTTIPYTFTGLGISTYYRLKVTCTVSGATVVSPGKLIKFTPLCPTTGVGQLGAREVELFPNPVNDVLTIQAEAGVFTSFTITNAIGQHMMQQPMNGALTQVNVSSLPTGMYYVTLHSADGSEVRKFVKW